MYKPLPEGLTIKDSPVHGLGLHASKKLAKGIDLGITHVYNENYENNYIRTPLGGFINHSDDPNAQLMIVGKTMRLSTIKTIKKNKELLVQYRLYSV